MLQELSYRKKIPSVDILTMECVASCNTTITKSDPKTTIGQLSAMFKNIALPKGYGITRESLKSLYDHSFDGDIDFAALSVITDILSKGIILSHWADAHTIVDKTSVIAAPIEINNERYYAVLISGKKKSEFKYPYVMRVFSDAYIKDELLNIYRTSPQGVTTSRQNADFQKFAANLLINYILNNSDLSFLTTNSANTQNNDNNQQPINCNRNMNTKVIRLTESDLHRIVKESVNKVLTELDWRTYANAGKKAHDEVLDKMKRGTSLDDLRKDSDFMKRARQTRKFRDQAVASSRDKFKELNDDENDFYTTVGPDDTYYANVENDSWGRPMVADKDGKTKMQGLSRPKMVNVNPERYFGYGNNEKVSDWNKFSKEINDFNSGKSKYIQGQGWQ